MHTGQQLHTEVINFYPSQLCMALCISGLLISQCVLCCLLRGKSGEQKMSDLPSDRMQEAPPFTYCAVDYFGPFYIKDKRKEVKQYGSLFTCLASRAVHIEVADSLDTDSFIMALRCFIHLRGNIHELHSDWGTNFVRAQ